MISTFRQAMPLAFTLILQAGDPVGDDMDLAGLGYDVFIVICPNIGGCIQEIWSQKMRYKMAIENEQEPPKPMHLKTPHLTLDGHVLLLSEAGYLHCFLP